MRALVALIAALVCFCAAAPASAQTTLNLTDERFVCTGHLSDYGPLPLTLNQTLANSSPAAQHVQGAIDIRSGCTAEGHAGIDLIIHQAGNGSTVGPGWDALVTRLGSHDIDITGHLNCGALAPGAHQDGADIRGGLRLSFNIDIGNWATQTATCHGAGGLFYPSGFQNGGPLGDRASDYVTDVVCDDCRMVGSKPEAGDAGRGLFIVESVRSGATNSCFSANLPLQIRLDDGTRTHGAIDPVNEGNLAIDRNDGIPDDPTACTATGEGPIDPPPPPPCDTICELAAALAQAQADLADRAAELADCKLKLTRARIQLNSTRPASQKVTAARNVINNTTYCVV